MPPAPPLSSSPLPSASKSASVGMADTQNRNQKELNAAVSQHPLVEENQAAGVSARSEGVCGIRQTDEVPSSHPPGGSRDTVTLSRSCQPQRQQPQRCIR